MAVAWCDGFVPVPQGLSCHSPLGLHATKRVPVPGLRPGTRAKLCTGHIKRHRFQVVALSEQPGSQPLRQEVVAVLGAAALVASSLSAAGMSQWVLCVWADHSDTPAVVVATAGPSFAQDSLLSVSLHPCLPV